LHYTAAKFNQALLSLAQVEGSAGADKQQESFQQLLQLHHQCAKGS
jgi:hypothetical protein